MTTTLACRSLYVHVPFCRHLCGYCDFYSQLLDRAAVPAFVDAVLCELDRYAERHALSVDTIYVGGGTPTAIAPAELERLLAGLRKRVVAEADLEFTVEANPATVTKEVAAILAAAGVNRVSIGAQSFNASELRVLDRTHHPKQVGQTVEQCRRYGIRRINLDLIFGVPGQTLASWQTSLRAAVALNPDHLSCYALTYEPGTPLHQRLQTGALRAVEEELEAQMYQAAIDELEACGFHQYEISNFARPGAECRHNLRYWHNEPYLGLGPAAAGLIDEVRYKNVADTSAYIQAIGQGRSPWIEQEHLPPDRRARETAMLELRLREGIDRRRFAERYGQDPVVLFSEAIERHAACGLLVMDDASVRLTRAGQFVADRVIVDFL